MHICYTCLSVFSHVGNDSDICTNFSIFLCNAHIKQHGKTYGLLKNRTYLNPYTNTHVKKYNKLKLKYLNLFEAMTNHSIFPKTLIQRDQSNDSTSVNMEIPHMVSPP